METIISDTTRDIDQKIKNGVKPTHNDKKRVQQRIKQLDKEQQLLLFNSVIKPINIYSVTDNGTYFDLNDLTPEQFWKLQFNINLTHDCINRDKVIGELQKQCDKNNVYNKDYDIETTSLLNENVEHNNLESDSHTIDYQHLRIAVLKQCKYSDHYKPESESITLNDGQNKVIERNIYTDRRLYNKKF